MGLRNARRPPKVRVSQFLQKYFLKLEHPICRCTTKTSTWASDPAKSPSELHGRIMDSCKTVQKQTKKGDLEDGAKTEVVEDEVVVGTVEYEDTVVVSGKQSDLVQCSTTFSGIEYLQ